MCFLIKTDPELFNPTFKISRSDICLRSNHNDCTDTESMQATTQNGDCARMSLNIAYSLLTLLALSGIAAIFVAGFLWKRLLNNNQSNWAFALLSLVNYTISTAIQVVVLLLGVVKGLKGMLWIVITFWFGAFLNLGLSTLFGQILAHSQLPATIPPR